MLCITQENQLFSDSHIWIKNQGGFSDVTTGAYDQTEMRELPSTYILIVFSKILNVLSKTIFGLSRDNSWLF